MLILAAMLKTVAFALGVAGGGFVLLSSIGCVFGRVLLWKVPSLSAVAGVISALTASCYCSVVICAPATWLPVSMRFSSS